MNSSSLAAARSATPHASTSTNPTRPLRPPPPVVLPRRPAGGTTQSIVVNPCQRGNPVLDCIKNVPWEYGQVVPDYQVGATTGVLFLSLRYHRLHPEYVHSRIAKLEGRYQLRVLLMMCDVSEHEEPIRELTKVCLINNLTIMVAWTAEEAGLYLSTYKLFEHRPPDRIKERVDKDYASLLRAALTSIRGVNRTDVTTLSSNIGSVKEMAEASVEQLLACPGFGEVKSRRVAEAFQRPFRNGKAGGTGALARRGETPAEPEPEPEPPTPEEEEGVRAPAAPSPANGARRQRAPSPEWDALDLDLDLPSDEAADRDGSPAPPLPPAAQPASAAQVRNELELELESSDDDEPPAKRARVEGAPAGATGGGKGRESPEWDIELDLN